MEYELFTSWKYSCYPDRMPAVCTRLYSTTSTSSVSGSSFCHRTAKHPCVAGAGLKAPLDEIGPLFTEKYGIAVQYNYGGAGALVPQMNLTRKGDVFMPGSTMEFKTAKSQGLVNESKFVAYHVPVIVVQKGNPKNITTLADFAPTRPQDRSWRCQCHGNREIRCKNVCSAQHQCSR